MNLTSRSSSRCCHLSPLNVTLAFFILQLYLLEGDPAYDEAVAAAVKLHPASANLLRLSVERAIARGDPPAGVAGRFVAAGSEDKALWKLVYGEALSAGDEKATATLDRAASAAGRPAVVAALREMRLDAAYKSTGGIEAARKYYDGEVYQPPFSRDLHTKMLELERLESKVNPKRVRRIFEAASDQFGKTDIGERVTF